MRRLLLCAATVAGLWAGSGAADSALAIRDAWIPEAPPGVNVQAGYMELSNPGPAAAVVVGAQSPDFAQVEIHRTVLTQGTTRMEAKRELRIDPGTTVALTPGGLHLMLIGPKRRLLAGDRIDVELRLADGNPVRTTVEVRGAPAAGAAEGHHHHH